MLADQDTNLVYISDLLRRRFPAIATQLRHVLGRRLRVIHGTKDIWCRDYMPVQIARHRFVQFRYDPSYLRHDARLRTQNAAALLSLKDCRHSTLRLDGGNLVHWNDVAIVTEAVYEENPERTRAAIREELRTLLEIDRLVVIPCEPGDPLGHADGMVRFVNERAVLVNDYSTCDQDFGKRLLAMLKREGFQTVRMPYIPDVHADDRHAIPSAGGVYINFLQTRDALLYPVFGMRADELAAKILADSFTGATLIPVLCKTLAEQGGAINCATWNTRSDVALRATT